MLSGKVSLLEQELSNYKHIDSLRLEIDSLRVKTISKLTNDVNDLQKTVTKQKTKIKRRNWLLGGSGLTIICLILAL